jgi:F-type H+-transporting ATPase subunit epsilon
MAGELTLRVITPDKIALDARVSSVRIPGVDGFIGILPRHAPMVAAVAIGELRYVQDGREHFLFVSEGFAQVRNNTVRVVCEAGEVPEEIDAARAMAAEQRARERLAQAKQLSAGEAIDLLRAEAALRRALQRLGLAERSGRDRVRT